MTKSLAQRRAEIAWMVKYGETERAEDARREYYTELLIKTIHDVLAKAPPLRPEQVERLITHLTVAVAGVPS